MTTKAKILSPHLNAIAGVINDQLKLAAGEEIAWVMVCQTTDAVAHYVSNASREGGLSLLQSQIEHWKAGRADIPASYNPDLMPIDMILFCPACHTQHIDAPDPSPQFGTSDEIWTNPPHRSHLCHHCGFIWRPSDHYTNGVQAIKTVGKNDS